MAHQMLQPRGCECCFQYPCDVNGFAAQAVGDLMSATCSVGNDQVGGAGLSECRKQGYLGHGQRDVMVLGLIAECTGHAAAARLDGPQLESWHVAKHRLYRAHAFKRLLVAMTVQVGHLRAPIL